MRGSNSNVIILVITIGTLMIGKDAKGISKRVKQMQNMLRDIRSYRSLVAEYNAIIYEISVLYEPIKSPMTNESSQSNVPSNPTQNATFRILEEKERRKKRLRELEIRINDILRMVEEIEDGEIKSMVRLHYIANVTWKEVSRIMYQIEDADYVRMKVNKYFERARQWKK